MAINQNNNNYDTFHLDASQGGRFYSNAHTVAGFSFGGGTVFLQNVASGNDFVICQLPSPGSGVLSCETGSNKQFQYCNDGNIMQEPTGVSIIDEIIDQCQVITLTAVPLCIVVSKPA